MTLAQVLIPSYVNETCDKRPKQCLQSQLVLISKSQYAQVCHSSFR